MVLKTFLLVCCLSTASAALFSQPKITAAFENERLEKVVEYLEKKSGYQFVYRRGLLTDKTVSGIDLRGATLEQALDMVLAQSGFEYDIMDNIVVIRQAARASVVQQAPARISGTVSDERGNPLAGATVFSENDPRSGTVADARGRFIISVPTTSGTLIVSFLGYQNQRVAFDPNTGPLRIVLKEAAVEMEEVVVTGYQNIRASDMVGSTGSVKAKDLYNNGSNSIEQMLQGVLPGMVVMNTDGKVGARQKVRVRGTSTLLGNQEPVWVVDGIIQEDPLPFKAQELDAYYSSGFDESSFDMMRDFVGSAVSWLNPNDIEDITILKDASATVLYGVKAANGVIVITTKKGQAGRLSVNYSGNFSVTSKLGYEQMNLMNSKERIDVSREMYARRIYGTRINEKVGYEYTLQRYLNKELTYAQFNDEVKYLEGVNTDWFDILFRTPFSHNHSVSLSGGSDNLTYYASVNAGQVVGTAKGNYSESYGTMINIDSRINSRLTLSMRLNASMDQTDSFYLGDPYTYASTVSRAIPAYEENGDLFFYDREAGAYFFRYNFINERDNTGNSNESRDFALNLNMKYDIVKGLRYETVFGLSSSNVNSESYATENTFYITNKRGYEVGAYGPNDTKYKESKLPHGGELNTIESRNTSITWRNQLTWNRLFAEKHRINVMVGQEIRSTTLKGISATTYGYFPDKGKNVTLPPTTHLFFGAAQPNSLYNSIRTTIADSRSNFLSFYGSATYSFDERYVWTGSIRSDASNRFGQDKRHRFLPVWSMGVRWNVHNEPWMRDQNAVSELNLRSTYGWQGNVADGVGPDLILKIPASVVKRYTGEMALEIGSLPYADLRWEKTATYNLGLDVVFFKNRLMFSAEYYRKNTTDLVIYEELPSEFGMKSMPVNAGRMTNEGIEFMVRGTVVRARDFVWTLSLNLAKTHNRLKSDIDRSAQWRYATTGQLNKEGYPVTGIWAFQFTGINQLSGSPEFLLPSAEENPNATTDVTAFMKYMGKLDSDYSGGISTVFRYKTLTLSASFNLNVGGKKFLYNMFSDTGVPSAYNNLPKEFVDRWRPDNPGSLIPGIPDNKLEIIVENLSYMPRVMLPTGKYEYLYTMYNYSDARVVDASYIRCNNISLSYTVPEKYVKRLRLQNLSLSASVTNPFVVASSELNGMDPEVATGKQPFTQTYSLNVNISF